MKAFSLLGIVVACLVSMPANAYYRHSHASHSYYRSVDGYRVHGPDYNHHNVSAHCGDGTLSHSRHARGTCSHHNGVAYWG
jgi:hypothetical protein